MQNLADFLIVVVIGLNVFLGVTILFRSSRSAVNRYYGVFVTLVSLFIVTVFIENRPALAGPGGELFLKLDFSFALLLLWAWLGFCRTFSGSVVRRWVAVLVQIVLPAGFIALIFSTDLIIRNVRIFPESGPVFDIGPLWFGYAAFLLFLALQGIYFLALRRRKASAIRDILKMRQIDFIFAGFGLSIGSGIVFFLFLQTFAILPAWLPADGGLYGMVFITLFTGYAITKYKLFDIRVIMVHLLMLVLFSLGLGYFFHELGESGASHLEDTGMFFLLVIVGGGLLWSIDRESEERGRAEELLGRLRDFVSFATHELRGPVANFKGAISMVVEGDFGTIPEELHDVLRGLYIEADQMGQTVDMFLNINKVEVGQFRLNPAEHDMAALLRSAVEQAEYQLGKRHLSLELSIPEGPMPAVFDYFKLQHVVRNVLDNAIKYTDPGGEVAVSLNGSKDRIELRVSDTGIGMSAETLKNIFTKYDPGPTGARQHIEGHGIGMWLSKHIVDLHGGTILAESPGLGAGSTFVVSIPRFAKHSDVSTNHDHA
jgi:signal transduction histidine kinase